MAGPQYLSTNPNAGQAAGGYLSTDPSAGTPPPTTAPVAAANRLDQLLGLFPMAGGMVGGAAGGVPGAALGGAAGAGYRELASHAREIPGAALDVLQNLLTEPGATLRGAAEGAADGAKNAGVDAALQALYELGGRAVTSGVSKGARAVYRGYLKPSLSKVNLPKARQVVETAIQEWLPMTKSGMEHAQQVISELRGQVDAILEKTTGTVDLSEIANKVRAFAQRRYNRPGVDPADLEAAMKVADKIDQHPSMVNPFNPQSPATSNLPGANQIKRDLQEGVGTSQYGIPSRAAKTSEKVGARETRLAIERQAPTVGPLNARESRLIETAKALERATGRDANRDALIGTRMVFSGALGAGEYGRTGNPAQAFTEALATRMLLSPAIATRAAILAAQLADRVPGTAVADAARIAILTVLQSQQPEGER